MRAAADRKLRVAIIGHTGRGNYGHALDTMWRQAAETEVVAVADTDEKGLAAAQKRLGLNNGFADYRRMLAEIRPDIAAICPRHLTEHCEMALAAIEAGVRGIYLEKPFCRTLVEADAIVAACAAAEGEAGRRSSESLSSGAPGGRPVAPGRRSGAGAGDPWTRQGRPSRRRAGSWDLGTHVLNLAHHFAGAAGLFGRLVAGSSPRHAHDVREAAEGEGPVAGNELHARFEMQRGVPVFFDSLRDAGNREAGFGLQLVGTQGIVDLRFDKQPFARTPAWQSVLAYRQAASLGADQYCRDRKAGAANRSGCRISIPAMGCYGPDRSDPRRSSPAVQRGGRARDGGDGFGGLRVAPARRTSGDLPSANAAEPADAPVSDAARAAARAEVSVVGPGKPTP